MIVSVEKCSHPLVVFSGKQETVTGDGYIILVNCLLCHGTFDFYAKDLYKKSVLYQKKEETGNARN